MVKRQRARLQPSCEGLIANSETLSWWMMARDEQERGKMKGMEVDTDKIAVMPKCLINDVTVKMALGRWRWIRCQSRSSIVTEG